MRADIHGKQLQDFVVLFVNQHQIVFDLHSKISPAARRFKTAPFFLLHSINASTFEKV